MSWIRDAFIEDPRQNGAGPGFVRYTMREFSLLQRQHNIMVFVGNGFDIQVLHDYSQPIDSRYETFYHYLKMREFDSSNVLFQHMAAELQLHQQCGGHGNWSDIEAAISSTLANQGHGAGKIYNDLGSIQAEFARFLQGVVPSSLLDQVGRDAERNNWSLTSLSEFLADIEDPDEFQAMQFPASIGHHELFNFLFVNFNYTTLLDDYIHLDQKQFVPLKYNTVDTNFTFKNDPRSHWNPDGEPDLGYSGYVISDVIHPHGILSTPRSLLFGIDAEDDYKKSRSEVHRLKKPYWSQAHALYRNHFLQADLFIIFGCSMGDSDGWWWRNIVHGLRNTKKQTPSMSRGLWSEGDSVEEKAELIIYQRNSEGRYTVESTKNQFLRAAGVSSNGQDRKDLLDRIHVVHYEDTTPRAFLKTR